MKQIEIRIKALELAIANTMRQKPVMELAKEYETYLSEVNEVKPKKEVRK